MKSRLLWLSALVILTIGVARAPEVQAAQKEDLRRLFGKYDANRDSRLSEHEFIGEKAGSSRAKARKQFRKLDEDGDSWLTLPEFTRPGHN